MKFFLHILLHILAIGAVFWAIETYLFPTRFEIVGDNFWMAHGAIALIFGVLSTFIKPFLKLAMLPIQLITLGVSGFLLNGILLWGLTFVLDILQIPGVHLEISGIITYVVAGLVLGTANTVIHKVL